MRTTSLFALLTLNMAATAGGIDRDSALQALQQPDVVLIDVRTAEEFAEGALPGATRIETAELAHNIEALAPRKDTPVVLYCRSGRRSSAAQEVLEKLGYSQVINAGGYDQLASALQRD